MTIEAPAVTRSDGDAPRADERARERARPTRRALARADLLIALIVFAMAIAPRAAWVAYNDRAPQGLNDPTLYSLFGDIIADGGGYTRPTGEPFAYYPVGFPATVGGLKKASDLIDARRSVFSVKMMNGVFGALTVVLVAALASRLFDRRVGFAAGALLAVFPSQVYYTGTYLSEPLFTLLFVAALTALLWHPWDRDGMSWPRLAAAGLLLSAATMTRGITLVFPLLLLVVWLFTLRSRRRALGQTLVLFAGIAVLVVPWSIRNSLAFDTLVGPSTNLGDDLCIGNFDGAPGYFVLHGKCFEGFEGLGPKEVEIQRNREGFKIAVQDLSAEPFRIPGLVARKAYWLLYKDDDGLYAAESYNNDLFIGNYRREVLAFAANSIYYATGVIVVLGALAFALAPDVRRLVVLLSMLYVLAVPLAFFGDPRFHFPAIPLAVIIAAYTVVSVWDRRRAAAAT